MDGVIRLEAEIQLYREQYHDARLEVCRLLDELRSVRLVLEKAQAAMWDAHYGHGIAVEYARSVDAQIRAALQVKQSPLAGDTRRD